MGAWTFTFTDMIEAFPTLPKEERVLADLNISGKSDEASGEFSVRWYDHSGVPTPRLEAFCDSWLAVEASGIVPLLAAHDTNKHPRVFGRSETPPVTIGQIKWELLALGFTDTTPMYRAQGPDRCSTCNGSGWLYKTAGASS